MGRVMLSREAALESWSGRDVAGAGEDVGGGEVEGAPGMTGVGTKVARDSTALPARAPSLGESNSSDEKLQEDLFWNSLLPAPRICSANGTCVPEDAANPECVI